MAVELFLADVHQLQFDGHFILLEDLAIGLVKLDAVAIVGDVTAGHHDAGYGLAQAIGGHGGGGDLTTVDNGVAVVLDGRGHGGEDPRAAGPEVTGDGDGATL